MPLGSCINLAHSFSHKIGLCSCFANIVLTLFCFSAHQILSLTGINLQRQSIIVSLLVTYMNIISWCLFMHFKYGVLSYS